MFEGAEYPERWCLEYIVPILKVDILAKQNNTEFFTLYNILAKMFSQILLNKDLPNGIKSMKT